MLTLFALSANHTNMQVGERERIAVVTDTLGACYNALLKQPQCDGVLILSTCNRTELYAYCATAGAFDTLVETFAQVAGVPASILAKTQRLQGDAAVAHCMRVACGMHSMVLGEPQILGQMKAAYDSAKHHQALGGTLDQFLQFVFFKVKTIRTSLPLGREPVSIVATMVKVLKNIFDSFTDKRLLLVGAGETIELAANYLRGLGMQHITVCNRTLSNAQALCARIGGHAAALYDLPQQLQQADLVVTATVSQLPIIGKGVVEAAVNHRHNQSLVLFDLAVPRDVEAQVQTIDGVFVYTIDDLGEIIETNKQMRQQAAEKANVLINDALNEWRQLVVLAYIGKTIIAPFRSEAEQLRDAELDQAMRELARGTMPEFVLFTLAHNLTKKLLHTPSIEIKKRSHPMQETSDYDTDEDDRPIVHH